MKFSVSSHSHFWNWPHLEELPIQMKSNGFYLINSSSADSRVKVQTFLHLFTPWHSWLPGKVLLNFAAIKASRQTQWFLHMPDLRFAEWCCWKFKSSGMLHSVTDQIVFNILGNHNVLICKSSNPSQHHIPQEFSLCCDKCFQKHDTVTYLKLRSKTSGVYQISNN
jgi:hypothetical protein